MSRERLEGQSHAARPTDLVALVTFDDQVRENQAVTVEGLADPDQQKARPLNAALAQWLHLGRRMWINVDGREVRGIATARDLNARSAWAIDTLIDASGADAGDDVLTDLLGQAVQAAADAQVTHLLLRTGLEAPARAAATRAGFRPALAERLWRGRPRGVTRAGLRSVRPMTPADERALFQLYCRAVPAEARVQLGMTREEWVTVRDRRWLRGGDEVVIERDGAIVGRAAFHEYDGRVQLEILTEADDHEAASALLATAIERTAPAELQALVPRSSGAVERVLAEAGLDAGPEYIRLCYRIARPVEAEAPVRAGMPVPSGGGA